MRARPSGSLLEDMAVRVSAHVLFHPICAAVHVAARRRCTLVKGCGPLARLHMKPVRNSPPFAGLLYSTAVIYSSAVPVDFFVSDLCSAWHAFRWCLALRFPPSCPLVPLLCAAFVAAAEL